MVGHGRTRVVLLVHGARLGLRQVRVRDRVRARVRAAALDRQLAAGASPESSVDLALHAARLCRPEPRRALAGSLSRVAAAADARTPLARPPVCRSSVRQARRELAAVAERLTAAEPVGVQGVARIRRLLADGAGPLYRASAPEQLRHALAAALEAMDPSR